MDHLEIFHGDNFNTKSLSPKLMLNGNNQEGVGIYFGTIDVAKGYGGNIIKAKVNKEKLIASREPIEKYLSHEKIRKIINMLGEKEPSAIVSYLQDWGFEVYSPDEITFSDLDEIVNSIKSEEVRNFQIELSQRFGVENFVSVWNAETDIQGTFDNETGFYAIIDTSITVEPYSDNVSIKKVQTKDVDNIQEEDEEASPSL